MFKRVCLIVLDSLGVGELPDAAKFGDAGAHTLKHLRGVSLDNLKKLGLYALARLPDDEKTFASYFCRMAEVSNGKDTTTGHWEMMGLPLNEGLSSFPEGFPADLMKEFTKRTGLDFLGNKPASGTVIIDELGEQHVKTGRPIVYTSADSVFQIAWHEEKYGLDRLYEICKITRKLLDESPYKVGRVIARPFRGTSGNFKRTENRRDFSLRPPADTALIPLSEKTGVIGIGKIPYIFDFLGITRPLEAHNDREAIEQTLNALKNIPEGLIFTNLNDLDMLYGHRRDVEGYSNHLQTLDRELPKILAALTKDDLLILTADHGNDPSFKGTDHTREYVPMIAYSPRFVPGSLQQRLLPDRKSFSDLGQTLLDNFGISHPKVGEGFLSRLTA